MTASVLPDDPGGPNEGAERRRSALEALGNDPEATECQLSALSDVDWRVRKQAILGLSARTLDSASLRRLVAMFQSGPGVAARNAAVAVLGTQGLAAVRLIEDALFTLDVDAKKLAAEALGRSAQAAALVGLRRLLADPDLNVRVAGIEAIAEVGASAEDAARAALEGQLGTADPYLTIHVLQAMDRLGIAPTWDVLEPLLEQPLLVEPVLRIAARLGSVAAAPHYVKALERFRGNSWDSVVGAFAQYAKCGSTAWSAARLALQGMTDATTERVFATVGARSPEVAGAALTLVCAEGTRRGQELALDATSSDELVAAATAALKRCGAAAAPVLFEAIAGDSDRTVEAVSLLTHFIQSGELGPATVGQLRRLASHESPRVVRAWLQMVALFGDETDLELAASWVSEVPSRSVRHAAVEAVRECARRFPDAIRRAALDVSFKAERAAIVALGMSVAEAPVLGSSAHDLAFLMGAASSEYVCVRCAVMAALGKQAVPDAIAALSFALRDEAADVRMAAIAGIGELRDPSGMSLGASQLIEYAMTTTDSGLGLAAFRALPEQIHLTALAKLLSAVRASDGWRAVGAAEALVRLQHTGAALAAPIASEARLAVASRLGQERDPDVSAELRRSFVELGS